MGVDAEPIPSTARSLPACAHLAGERSRMNSRSSIFRLPTETLEAIFIDGAHDHYSEHGGDHISTAPSWVNVSYVCRHWRSVALNSSTLWTYLFINSPRWTEELLSRSKQASLKLWVDVKDWDEISPEEHFLDQVVDHVERIEEFNLRMDLFDFDDDEPTPFPEILLSHAPRLRYLTIEIGCFPSTREWPSMPFNGGTPALRTLKFMSCPAAWQSFKTSGLTTLRLERVPLQFQSNMADFVAALGCMQDLRDLHLSYALPSVDGFLTSTAFDGLQKPHLSRLSHLSISESIPQIVVFLSCVNIPLKTRIKLWLHYEPNSSHNDHTQLSSLLARRLSDDRTSSTQKVRSLVSEGTISLAFSALDCDTPISILRTSWDNNILLHVQFLFEGSMTTSVKEHIISDFCGRMALTDISCLHGIHPPVSSAFWSEMLGHFPHLQYLMLSQGPMPYLASVLSPVPHNDAESKDEDGERAPADRLLAPVLEVLYLREISFSRSADADDDTPPPLDVHSLYNTLVSRKGSPGQLTMVRCVAAPHLIMEGAGRWKDGSFVVSSAYQRYPEPEGGGG